MNNKKPAFSLLELLVTVAVIGILLTIFLGAIGYAKDLSKQAVCASNLRQIQHGYFLYDQDFPGYFPSIYPYGNVGVPPYWDHCWRKYILDHYLGGLHSLLECPGFSPDDWWDDHPINELYGINYYLLPVNFDWGSHPFQITRELQNDPSRLIFFAENRGDPTVNYQKIAAGKAVVKFRHRDTTNMDFADGHIEAVNGHLENRVTPFAVFDDPAVYGWWEWNK